MYIGIPQAIILGLYVLACGISIAKHGCPKEGYENGWVTIIATGIATGILYWGGFFDGR